MANINNKNTLLWVGTSSNLCTDISIAEKTKIEIAVQHLRLYYIFRALQAYLHGQM